MDMDSTLRMLIDFINQRVDQQGNVINKDEDRFQISEFFDLYESHRDLYKEEITSGQLSKKIQAILDVKSIAINKKIGDKSKKSAGFRMTLDQMISRMRLIMQDPDYRFGLNLEDVESQSKPKSEFKHHSKSQSEVIFSVESGQKRKRSTIPKILREQVWGTYINTLKSDCLICADKTITAFDFECGHVDADGLVSIDNLRPICRLCNSSMGRQNMKEFAETYFPKAKVLLSF
jgi:hypothetical protein